MEKILSKNQLLLILNKVFEPYLFFILGAGTSYKLVPVTSEMRNEIKKTYAETGIYPVSKQEGSELFKRVIGEIDNKRNDIKEFILSLMPGPSLDLLVQKALYLPFQKAKPSQYAIFDLIPSPAILFNFNLDGLASIYCSNRHIIETPHGSIDFEIVGSPNFYDWLEFTSEFESYIAYLRYKLLPGPEPKDITRRFSYSNAKNFFPNAKRVIIIGYSFGMYKGKFDDIESFDFFIELLKNYPKEIILLDKNPYELTERINEKLKNSLAIPIPVRWEILTQCILRLYYKYKCYSYRDFFKNIDFIIKDYYLALEKEY